MCRQERAPLKEPFTSWAVWVSWGKGAARVGDSDVWG
jgi:hypothetical protein